jgi:4-hydroxy-tetrahydrodipicolinate reductase
MAAGQGIAPVVGTSGLTKADLSALADACRRGGVGALVVPNFSVGAVLQMQFAEQLARWMTCDGIHETHHAGKLDSPSGTAEATARRVTDVTAEDPPVIHSQRRDGVVAIQRVGFSALGEHVELTHEITDRAAFMPGLLLAVRAVRDLDGLVIGLDDLLGPAAPQR